MKERSSNTDQKIEEILQSLDGIQQAAPAPWFYTRVKARLLRDEKTGWTAVGSFLSRPVVAIAGLCIILVMNAVLVLKQDNRPETAASFASQAENQPVTDNDVIIASTGSFDYENLIQP